MSITASPAHSRVFPLRERTPVRTAIALLLLVLQLGGCFRYVPVATAQPGSLVTVSINDRGRVALAESIGPGVRELTGQLRENDDDRVVLALRTVTFMDVNVPVVMERERVEIPREYMFQLRERQLSRSRSILAGVLVAAGIVAASFIAIAGFGGDDAGDRVPGGPGDPQ